MSYNKSIIHCCESCNKLQKELNTSIEMWEILKKRIAYTINKSYGWDTSMVKEVFKCVEYWMSNIEKNTQEELDFINREIEKDKTYVGNLND